jgi:hypothetical protein
VTYIRDKWFFILLLLALSAVGVFALLQSTPYGLGLVNDSAAYIGGAMNILDGNGYARTSGGGEIKPITHFPPLFSIILAGIGLTGIDLLLASRILISILFGLDILLVGLSIYKITQSPAFALFGALLLAVSDTHLGVYSFALSEPLFLTIMLVAYLLFAEYFDRHSWYWLSLSGITLGIAYLTRYAGVSLFITLFLALLYLKTDWSRPLKNLPLKEMGILLASSLPPVFAWMVYNFLTIGSLGNRQIIYHPVGANKLFEGLKNLLSWIAPDDLLAWQKIFGQILSGVSLLLLPGLLLALGWVWWRYLWKPDSQHKIEINGSFSLAATLALHILVYICFIVISISLFDATTPLDSRILSIIYLPTLILLASALARVWQISNQRYKTLRWLIALFCIAFVLVSIKDGLDKVNQLRVHGQGFSYQVWSESEAVKAIREMPPITIYSDKPTGIFFWTGKSSYVVPTPLDAVTTKPRPNYTSDLERMKSLIQEGKAILVLFELQHSLDPNDAVHFDELTSSLSLQVDYGIAMIFIGSQ